MPPVQQPQMQPQGAMQPVYPVAPQPAPVQPAIDLDTFRKEIADDIVNKLAEKQEQQQPQQQAEQDTSQKKYDDWGAVFNDVGALVEQKLQEREEAAKQVNEKVAEQSNENQKWIDTTIGQLRGSGYLPPVANQFDANDPGKQAENELLGYAIAMGTSNLAQAAQELKFRHDNGYRYDYTTRQFVSLKEQESGQPDLFGNVSEQTPPQPPAPVAAPTAPTYAPGFVPQQPVAGYPYPVGPSNPYMPVVNTPVYPPGFNAPVSNGASYGGVQGQAPSTNLLRNMSYDQIVETFNRTQ